MKLIQSTFIAGKLRHFFTACHQITNDSIMLGVIKNGIKKYQEWKNSFKIPQNGKEK